MKDTKLYKVMIGRDDKSGDSTNWMSRNVVALDALGAIKKVNLGKREYIAEVEIIATVDEPLTR